MTISNPRSKSIDDFRIKAKSLYPELALEDIYFSDGKKEISDPRVIAQSQLLYIRKSGEPPGWYIMIVDLYGPAPPDLQSADLFTSRFLLPAISSPEQDVENFLLVLDSIADRLCSPDFYPFERSERTGWPMAQNEQPLLLVHDLPKQGKKGWTKSSDLMQVGRRMTTILGTSGSGKTRLCFELLCQQYGIYFVAVPSDVLGSTDMSALTSFCESVFHSALKGTEKASNFVTRGVKCLVLSRLLVLRRLLSREKVITPKDWLLFQIKPRVEGIYRDIFNRIFHTLLNQANDIS